eukprot:1040992-Prymnesium_polylepis.2
MRFECLDAKPVSKYVMRLVNNRQDMRCTLFAGNQLDLASLQQYRSWTNIIRLVQHQKTSQHLRSNQSVCLAQCQPAYHM